MASSLDRKKNKSGIIGDLARGGELSKHVVGDGLGRIREESSISDARKMLREHTKGISGQQQMKQREIALEQMGYGHQTQTRQLQSNLAASGVKGGAAGAQMARLSMQGLQERRKLERDLSIDQMNAQRDGVKNFMQAESELAKFDLSQAANEKNLDIQARLGFAELASADRAAEKQRQATVASAHAKKSDGK